MRRKLISFALLLMDSFIVTVVPFLAVLIRFEGNADISYINLLVSYIPMTLISYITSFYLFGLYNRLWRYASINEVLVICGAVTTSSIVMYIYMYAYGLMLPKSIYLLSWFFNIAFIGGSRLVVRIVNYLRQRISRQCIKVLIIGAGDAGAMIARELKQRYFDSKKIIGFIDDDPYKQKQRLFGVKVLGGRESIERAVKEYGINEIIIAMPSADGSTIRSIISECKKTNCSVKILPGIYELIDGVVTVQQLRDVEVVDLLGREPVKLNLNEITAYLKGKRVLITGAGGSIGSELCRQIGKMSPSALYLLGKGENSIYEIDYELKQLYKNLDIIPIIADIRDEKRINDIFENFKPEVVFHAAAHKHVPLMEMHPREAVSNNIFGTKILAKAASRVDTDVFIMISTDKAVNPTSVMGATKRVAELIIQNLNSQSKTKFAAVRFGNVLGSRGSVIPLFKKQIASGGPITITHPEMKRYFMTIPEASQLVLQAGALAQGGEVFVLDMGTPVKIVNLAKDLIEISGLVPDKDIKIEFTGLRPGEKLFEELLTAEEGTTASKHEKIFKANLKDVDGENLSKFLSILKEFNDDLQIKDVLAEVVPTYKRPN